MFASIEVLIGLALVYLLLALIVTALTEWTSSAFRYRASNLHKAVRQMLDGASGSATNAERFYQHPRIVALSEGTRRPSYIPSRTFAEVVKDLNQQGDAFPILGGPPANVDAIEDRFLDTMNRASGWYKRKAVVISAIWATAVVVVANADTVAMAQRLWTSPSVRAAVVAQAERRVAMGRPKDVVDANYGDPEKAVPTESDKSAEEEESPNDLTADDRAALESLLGWSVDYKTINGKSCQRLQIERDMACAEPENEAACNAVLAKITLDDRCVVQRGALFATGAAPGDAITASVMTPIVVGHLFGWLLSIAAVSLGAPFWFDTLSRFVNLRGAGPAERPKNKGDLKSTNDERIPQS